MNNQELWSKAVTTGFFSLKYLLSLYFSMVYDYMTTVFYSEYFSENRIVLLVFSVVSLRAD